jgi:hypothetical protein
MLIDTHSEIEQQNARIQGGRYDGMRVSEVPTYTDALENSPQHYSAMIQRRPDFAPDVIESAQNSLHYTYDQAYDENFARSKKTTTEALVKKLDTERVRIALERMSPEALASAHYGLFEDIARVGNEKVEIRDPVTGKKTPTTLSTYLEDTIVKFNTQGGMVGQNAVGSLRGGKERYVNLALNAGVDPDEPPRVTLAEVQAREAPVTAPRVSASAVASPTGEIRIEHMMGERPDEVTSRPAQPPATPPAGGGSPGASTPPPTTRSYTPTQPDIPPEDFESGGRFPPPSV